MVRAYRAERDAIDRETAEREQEEEAALAAADIADDAEAQRRATEAASHAH